MSSHGVYRKEEEKDVSGLRSPTSSGPRRKLNG